MRSILLASFIALAHLATSAREARAEEAPVDAVTPEPPRSVRVTVKVHDEREFADVFVERRGQFESVCRAPCTFDAAPGERLRVDVYGSADELLTSTVRTDGASEQEIEVRRRGRGFLAGGLVAVGAGAISLALGMAIIRGADRTDLFQDLSANRALGTVLLVLGGLSAATGAVLIVKRSTAPFLETSRPTRIQALEDLRPARPIGETIGETFSAPQLGWTQAF